MRISVNFLSYLTDQELAILSYALAPLTILFLVLGIREILFPLIAFKKTDATFVAADHLPAAPHIYHVSFAYEIDGEPYESTTRDTYDEHAVQKRFDNEKPQRIYYRKKDPTFIKTSRSSAIMLGIVSLLIGAGLGAIDLYLFGMLVMPC